MDTQTLCFVDLPFGGKGYLQSLSLRDEVLRRPLGLSVYADDRSAEPDCWHFGAYAQDRLVGTLMLVPCDPYTVQMKQVAVDPTVRRRRIGARLVAYAESIARDRGIRTIFLHARQTAICFYEMLGYGVHGQPFTEVGIAHVSMCKQLS